MTIITKLTIIAGAIHDVLQKVYSTRLDKNFHGTIEIKVGIQAGNMTHLNIAGQNFQAKDLLEKKTT